MTVNINTKEMALWLILGLVAAFILLWLVFSRGIDWAVVGDNLRLH